MSATTLFFEPLDVLFLRGNKLFGDPGSFGESLVPPWPSVAAGAIRSRMLADAKLAFPAFARGEAAHPELGTPAEPGTFTVAAFHLARRRADGSVEILVAAPADLVLIEGTERRPVARALAPQPLAAGITASSPFPMAPVLADATRGKPAAGWWLTQEGWATYLSGGLPEPEHFVKSSALWVLDARVGVGLDAAQRRAADGRLFTVQAVAMVKRGHRIGESTIADYDTGFLAAIQGAQPPRSGSLRLGGDGRAAAVHVSDKTLPEPDYAAIAASRRCRLVLTTPGIFPGGWLPIGAQPQERGPDGAVLFRLHGVSGRIVCAAMPRFEVVSGWDLAQSAPKPALRAVPAGSVWWLDDLDASPEVLRKLVARGLWSEPCEDAARRAEGFNRCTFAAY